jgi:hypothetical protein
MVFGRRKAAAAADASAHARNVAREADRQSALERLGRYAAEDAVRHPPAAEPIGDGERRGPADRRAVDRRSQT